MTRYEAWAAWFEQHSPVTVEMRSAWYDGWNQACLSYNIPDKSMPDATAIKAALSWLGAAIKVAGHSNTTFDHETIAMYVDKALGILGSRP